MNYYRIEELLVPCSLKDTKKGDACYVALLNTEEWIKRRDSFGMGIDIDLTDNPDRTETKAIVNYDSLTGSICVPDRTNLTGEPHAFAFALDEKGIVLIDDEHYARDLVESIRLTKKWRMPSLERFLYDLLEKIIEDDLHLLEKTENRLDRLEEAILRQETEEFPAEINDIRSDLLELRIHYEQLIDFGQELEENENGFFLPENLRFFRMFTERVIRLQDRTTSLREYIVQLRDLVSSQLEVRQNRIMTLLTVVTSIFLPLTLIAGWYGMNFKYMPELEVKAAYPIIIGISVLIVVVSLIWFKKKKWM